MKQLVAPKPPHRILNEMVGAPVRYEYTENPPVPDELMTDEVAKLHTLMTVVDGDSSTGTGPNHEIAKNICAESAIMKVITRRYEEMNKKEQEGKNKDDLLVKDETPFELASIAIFKLLNEWEAGGFELPQALVDALYSQQMVVPAKQRGDWIKSSNMGYSTAITGGLTTSCRKRPMARPTDECIESKNPVAFLNEIRGALDYVLVGTWGSGNGTIFTMGVNIDGVAYSGAAPSKKDAKKNCAKEILAKLYGIKT